MTLTPAGRQALPEVAVVFPYARDTNAGGPCGFISQLMAGADIAGFSITPPVTVRRLGPGERLRRLVAFLLAGHSLRDRGLWQRWNVFLNAGCAGKPVLWFMDSGVYGQFRHFIRPDQRVVYQPHCPQLPWEELADSGAAASEVERRREETRALIARAQIVVLPNPGCLDIYGAELRPGQVRFLASASYTLDPMRRLPLDPALTHFLYIGRRNRIKGFDRVLAAFEAAWAQRQDIRLVILGSGERVSHPGVIDLGFSKDIELWFNSVDFLVNANRASYFDLSVMEAMSAGLPLAYTVNGGHKHLPVSPQLFPISDEDPEALVRFLVSARKPVEAERAALRAVHAEHFAIAAYHARLADFVRELQELAP